jgi:hypothetical protein
MAQESSRLLLPTVTAQGNGAWIQHTAEASPTITRMKEHRDSCIGCFAWT